MEPARSVCVLPLLAAALFSGGLCAAEPVPAWRSSLAVMPAAGGASRELVHDPKLACGSPRWSPDGEWVAYDTLDTDRERYDFASSRIRVVRADGTGERVVGSGGMPTWSPDGKDLAWHTYDDRGVVVARVDGSAEETIVDHWGNPVWLRDGSRILTISSRSDGLTAYNPQTGKETELIATPGIQYGYSVSPDGKWVSYRNYSDELVIASFDPAIAPRVRIAAGKAEYSAWSPDGERIVVSWAPPGAPRYRLYALSPHGEGAPRLLAGQREEDSHYQPDWSPDGESIIFRLQRRVITRPEVAGEDDRIEP